jgi:hypothetical protein
MRSSQRVYGGGFRPGQQTDARHFAEAIGNVTANDEGSNLVVAGGVEVDREHGNARGLGAVRLRDLEASDRLKQSVTGGDKTRPSSVRTKLRITKASFPAMFAPSHR